MTGTTSFILSPPNNFRLAAEADASCCIKKVDTVEDNGRLKPRTEEWLFAKLNNYRLVKTILEVVSPVAKLSME